MEKTLQDKIDYILMYWKIKKSEYEIVCMKMDKCKLRTIYEWAEIWARNDWGVQDFGELVMMMSNTKIDYHHRKNIDQEHLLQIERTNQELDALFRLADHVKKEKTKA